VETNLHQNSELKGIVAKLKAHFNPTKVYLFGSRAKGTAKTDSDYDLFLILKNSDKSRLERMKEAYSILGLGRSISLDIIIYTEAEFEEYRGEINSVASEVAAEGVEL
jgi:uncharacterized protein